MSKTITSYICLVRNRHCLLVALAFILNLALLPEAFALQEPQTCPPDGTRPFSLRAEVTNELAPQGNNKAPQLSRRDVAAMPSTVPPVGAFGLKADDGVPLLPSRPVQKPEDEPASSTREYGVDWSHWVSQLADRWFYNLKVLEDQSGLQFHTVRPCLFKFTCYPNGAIAISSLRQSSGIPMYDQLQAQALLQCQPVAPFPQGTQRTTFTLVQGWESHPRKRGEHDFRPGSFGHGFPVEIVKQWFNNGQ